MITSATAIPSMCAVLCDLYSQRRGLKVWLALPRFDGRASLPTWLYTIARNTGLSHLRSERYRRTESLDQSPEPRSAAVQRLDRLDVERLLRRLPIDQRTAVELFYLQERSLQDVAAMLGIPEGTVKSHLFRARRAMALMIEEKI
jgi:RNA polymerase sigma-70 factor, ECF subfamily